MKYKTINVKVSEEFYNQLILLKHSKSLERKEDLSMSDVIKEALKKHYKIKE